ncbi:uncharacterized protein RDI95_001885 isoform 2-T2 [Morus bassanus]
MGVTAGTTISSHSVSPTSKVTQAPESETTTDGSDHVPEKQLSTQLVAVISISCVILFGIIIGVFSAWKKSKRNLAETNSVSAGEPQVS